MFSQRILTCTMIRLNQIPKKSNNQTISKSEDRYVITMRSSEGVLKADRGEEWDLNVTTISTKWFMECEFITSYIFRRVRKIATSGY
jgi:hypothetical protein